jgi:hypothetical protein
MVTSQIEFFPELFRHLDKPRWIHIDLGVTSDAAGVSCGFVSEFKETPDSIGPMPVVEMDFILRVKPPANSEIQFHKIRSLISLLKQHGLPIKWVSFDSFQSVDSIQILRQIGVSTGRQSMDTTATPHSVLKTAIYAGRVLAPEHTVCQAELCGLEKNSKTGVVDHSPTGSKDCADSCGGVVYGLTMRREVWAMYGVQFTAQYESSKEVTLKSEEEQ